jgi:adenylate cyclase
MKSKLLKITGFRIGILITFLIVILYASNINFLHLIELNALDFRFIQRGKIEPESPIVMVGIDDKSVKEIGRWPWPRSYIADLIDFMTEADAKVVGFDITFSEPDLNSELRLINEINLKNNKDWNIKNDSFANYIKEKQKFADNDSRLGEAISRNGRVILGYYFPDEDIKERLDDDIQKRMTQNLDRIAKSKLSTIYYSSKEAQDTVFTEFKAADVNIKKISEHALGFGYFNVFFDIDGTVRWMPLVVKYQGELFPPLSLQVLREYLREEGADEENITVKVNELGVYDVKLYDYSIPTDKYGRVMINFRGPRNTFKYYPFIDVINGAVPKETFKDKMVIVGTYATGIYDIRVTPFSSVYPGVETHANVIDNILTRSSLISPDWAKAADLLTIILLGFIVSLLIPKLKASKSAVITLVILAGYLSLNYLIFVYAYIWLNVVYPMITLTFIPLVLYTYRFATEEREKRQIRGAFSHYLTESVVSEVLKNPDKLKLGGQKKDLTVLFSDIRGFTTISEELNPSELVSLLNEYLTAMTKIVFRYEGTLDKYIGDAIMAIYGAPQDQEDHSLRACMTALDMIRALYKLRLDWEKKNMPPINIGIGLNTGAMSVGNMGSQVRFDYTVMGDNVNLASRLEGTNKQYGTNIIISEFTYERVKEDVICRQIDVVRVKGKKHPVKIYQLLANLRYADKSLEDRRKEVKKHLSKKRRFMDKGAPDRRVKGSEDIQIMCADFEAALERYFKRDFEESLRMFKALGEKYPEDKPVKIFIRRVKELIKSPPPPDWDGVFTMTTK